MTSQTPASAMKLVPVEPTEAMIEAWVHASPDWQGFPLCTGLSDAEANAAAAKADWSAMLSAAPPAPAGRAEVERCDLQAADAEFAERMSRACDGTRAIRGRDEVAVRTADWHALMSLGEFARRRTAALKEPS